MENLLKEIEDICKPTSYNPSLQNPSFSSITHKKIWTLIKKFREKESENGRKPATVASTSTKH